MEDPDSNQTQEANIWHNPLYSFEYPFDTPFDTPKGEDNILIIMHAKEIKCHLEKQVRENERLKEAICAYQQDEPNTYACNEENRRGYYKNAFENIPLSGNGGNNTPPRTP